MTIKEQLQMLKEQELRKNIIIPMMHVLGCRYVKDNHGTQEYGIDVLYEKKGTFRRLIYGGIVLKNDKDVDKDGAHDIDRQAREAIAKFMDPQRMTCENRINELVIITSFNFRKQAIDYIHEQIYMGTFLNYHIIDGDQLQAIIEEMIFAYNKQMPPSELYVFNKDDFNEICYKLSGRPSTGSEFDNENSFGSLEETII